MKDYMEEGLKTLKERQNLHDREWLQHRKEEWYNFYEVANGFFFLAHSVNSYMASREHKKSQYKLKPLERVSKEPSGSTQVDWEETSCLRIHYSSLRIYYMMPKAI